MESQFGSESHSGTGAKPELSAKGTAMLHAALESASAARDSLSSAMLKSVLQQLCAEAKRNQWLPETLLIAFKGALYSLPATERLPRGAKRDELVAQLVSLCIDEYFGT